MKAEQGATDAERWQNVRQAFADADPVVFGHHWAHNFRKDPKRLPFVLSRYKFAAKMACKNAQVLELGCSEGIGAPILSEFAAGYHGVDLDAAAVTTARTNFGDAHHRFDVADILAVDLGSFDAVVSLDVVEHIELRDEDRYVRAVHAHLHPRGMAVIGTPNLTSDAYASEASRLGHVNLFDAERLRATLLRAFGVVFLFGANDEVVHTGFAPMAHYLLAVCCRRRPEVLP